MKHYCLNISLRFRFGQYSVLPLDHTMSGPEQTAKFLSYCLVNTHLSDANHDLSHLSPIPSFPLSSQPHLCFVILKHLGWPQLKVEWLSMSGLLGSAITDWDQQFMCLLSVLASSRLDGMFNISLHKMDLPRILSGLKGCTDFGMSDFEGVY